MGRFAWTSAKMIFLIASQIAKGYGDLSIGVDVTFPLSPSLTGLPSHASPASLPTTSGPGRRYDDPYRLYNLDVFEYELDTPMALYGSVPFVGGGGGGGEGSGGVLEQPDGDFRGRV